MNEQLEPIRPPLGPVAVTAPDQTGELMSELPGPLRAGAALVRAVSGCDGTAAILIALAAQGVAVGPSHRLARPRGDGWAHAALDLLLVDNPGGALGAALDVALCPVTTQIAGIIREYEPLSPVRLRARWARARELRIGLEARINGIDARLRTIEGCRAAGQMPPGGWSGTNADIELAAQRTLLLKEAAPLAIAETRMEFATRPVILTGGISPAMVKRWPGQTFDGHVVDLLAGGDVVAAFLGMPPRDLVRVLQFIALAGRGLGMFPLGDQQFLDASVRLLWRCGFADAAAIVSHPALQGGPLAGRHLLLTAPDEQPQSPPSAHDRGEWSAHLSRLLTNRLCRVRFDHALDGDAMGAYGAFREVCAGAATGGALGPAARAHLRDMPGLALGLALAIHLAGDGQDRPEVSGEEFALAAGIARAASRNHLAALDRFRTVQLEDRDPIGCDVEVMVAKLRVRGTASRRELFRGYHRQDYPRLEQILAAAIQNGRIVTEGDRLLAAPPDQCPRVGAPAEPGP